MPVELSHLMQLAYGQKTELQVGDLPRDVAEYLESHPAIVFLGHHELLKIRTSHLEIEVKEFQTLPMMIKDGRYIKDNKRANCVTLFYESIDTHKFYTAGLKATDSGGEVWVQTFHRTTANKARKREKRHGYLYGDDLF